MKKRMQEVLNEQAKKTSQYVTPERERGRFVSTPQSPGALETARLATRPSEGAVAAEQRAARFDAQRAMRASVFLALLAVSPLFAAELTIRNSKNGLEDATPYQICVGIEVARSAQSIGVSEQSLRARTELRLRQAGFEIISNAPREGHCYLYLNANATSSGVASLHLNLQRRVTFSVGGMAYSAIGTTWSDGGLSGASADKLRTGLDDLLDKFLNDYMRANPTKR